MGGEGSTAEDLPGKHSPQPWKQKEGKKSVSQLENKLKHPQKGRLLRRPSLIFTDRWFFRVGALPHFLYRYLVEGSCGIPYYCEELLKNLDHHRILIFQQAEAEEKTNVTWNNLFSE